MAINITSRESLNQYTKEDWESGTSLTINSSSSEDYQYFCGVFREQTFNNITSLQCSDRTKRDITGFMSSSSDLAFLSYVFPNLQTLVTTVRSPGLSPIALIVGDSSSSITLKAERIELNYISEAPTITDLTVQFNTLSVPIVEGAWRVTESNLVRFTLQV